MSYSFTAKKRFRKSFGKISSDMEMPNLIGIQNKSYESFLQINVPHEDRLDIGLNNALNSVFPVTDSMSTATLEYVSYSFDNPKYDVEECKQRGVNYSAPLKISVRLIVWDVELNPEKPEIKGIKEQDVYIGDIPLMTNNGTFIINGTERVVVSQMHRSPGVFFSHDKGKTHSSGKLLYSARIIPYRGSWLDFEFDAKEVLYFRIDRRRKILITTFLRALELSVEDIYNNFYNKELCTRYEDRWSISLHELWFKNKKIDYDLIDFDTKEVILESGSKLTPRKIKNFINQGVKKVLVPKEFFYGMYIGSDIVNPSTGEVVLELGSSINENVFLDFDNFDLDEFLLLSTDESLCFTPYIRNSLVLDKNLTYEDSLMEIYKVMRPGEPVTLEIAEEMFNSLFFDQERYDLSAVGRVKLNARLNLDLPETCTCLTKEDILKILKVFVNIKDGKGEIDDIDHLGSRRVRSVGELVENQFRIGLVRIERAIIERMGVVDIDTVMPHELVNYKLLISVMREFFGSSQLSQFMDQTNPLAEVTHKRRLSALGPGGLTRDHAGFEVRDVHTTHYGRICPIETPEGPNIGLINSLATYANINKYGFIESPYRRVVNGVVTKEVVYLSAIEEGKYIVAQSNAELDENGHFKHNLISCRNNGDFIMANASEIDFIDVSPMQVISVAASLIPFLENDDANRALMGSNMQRQAVPLLKSEAPLVGTGIEAVVAKDSGVTIVSENDGIVDSVDSNRIVIKSLDGGDSISPVVKIYNLLKYQRTNQNTCINQCPIVRKGDLVKAGDVIADGLSTELGELALGKNILVAFMPWNGYNFEDSILISEKVVRDDMFTSIHIEQFEISSRDTRLGPEEITRDIPNTSEESLRHLDEVGIVHVGAEVQAGDILVGKVTPKSESPITPEEKLLRAIFGEKASDVRDSSMRVPPDVRGTVIEVRVFSKRGVEKDERAVFIEQQEVERLSKDRDDEIEIVSNHVHERLRKVLVGCNIVESPVGGVTGKITDENINNIPNPKLWKYKVDDESVMQYIISLREQLDGVIKTANSTFNDKVKKLQSGDDLPQSVLKVVKVFLAVKRKLQPGDKMAGRHGNKGIVSKILPEEDMPYMEDGTRVDMVLNPLGVPSRMNVGQIWETHLGWASAGLGKIISRALLLYENSEKTESDLDLLKEKLIEVYMNTDIASEIKTMKDSEIIELANNLKKGIPFATPVFDGAKENDIEKIFNLADLDTSGQMRMIDGRTGEYFERKVTVGYIYMLKLHHLVDDKLHARSIGPYSLVTQQPLGGKSHFGGQRFGEMECWALQAYGAAYTLQEMLTVKSDDVEGRVKMYESIVRGDNNFGSGTPESFHVMVKELRSLNLNVSLENSDTE